MPENQNDRLGLKKDIRSYLLFFLFPLSQIILLLGIYLPGTASVSLPHILIPVVLCIASDAALAAALRYTARRASLQAENRAMEQKIDEQSRYYTALSEHYRAVRRVRHDIDNHLYTIRILAEDGKTEEATRYAEQLESKIDSAMQKEGASS